MYLNAALIHALEPSERRCFNRKEASSYVCLSVGSFDKLVRSGQLPRPIKLLGRKVWDRSDLDDAIDDLSGRTRRIVSAPRLSPSSPSHHEELDQELDQWKAKHGQG